MRSTLTITVATAAFLLVAQGAEATASACKGLDRATCGANKACAWMPERKAGETKSKSGAVHKSSARAHCRLNTRKSS